MTLPSGRNGSYHTEIVDMRAPQDVDFHFSQTTRMIVCHSNKMVALRCSQLLSTLPNRLRQGAAVGLDDVPFTNVPIIELVNLR